MREYQIHICDLSNWIPRLKKGDRVLLSGTVYTARDAAHKKIAEAIEQGESLPFPLAGAVIYYAGPTPTPPGQIIGSCGPTTSARMDRFTPQLYDMGLLATIGKGDRASEVYDAIQRNQGIYFCALGGAGALAAKRIKKCSVIAYESLGCESVKQLDLDQFPLVVAIDALGNSSFC